MTDMSPDEQEAGSFKYCAPRIWALESGLYAVCGMYSDLNGLPVEAIVDEKDMLLWLKVQCLSIRNHQDRPRPEKVRRTARTASPRTPTTLDDIL